MLLISCGGDDDTSVATDPVEQTEEEKQLELLSASVWKMSSITLDGAMQRLILVGSNLLSIGKTYSTNGSYDPVWPSSGTFSFGSDINTLTRDDGVSMTISVSRQVEILVSLVIQADDPMQYLATMCSALHLKLKTLTNKI